MTSPLIKKSVLLLAALFVSIPMFVQAQVVPDPVQFIVAPETPAPFSTVQIEVQGVGSFLGDANIVWTLDGSTAKQGVGERFFTFKTGALGKISKVGLRITSQTQGVITRSFVFSPSLVNMLWEADTTVPPLSKIKPLYSAGSPLRVVAFPVVYNGSSRIAATSLSFQWRLNDNPITNASGLGRSVLNIQGDQLRNTEDVQVDVYFGNTKVAQGELSIPAVTPNVILYERDALRGTIIDTAIPQSINLQGKEITLQAEPLYFSALARTNGALRYIWTIGDTETTGPLSAQGVLTLRQTGGGVGSATIGVSVQNQNNSQFVQAADAFVQMVFGQSPGLLRSLFGI